MKKIIDTLMIGYGLLAALWLAACNDKLETERVYGFSLSHWYLQEEITPGDTVEIRFTLRRDGNYAGASYRVGYTQLSGEGEVFDCEELKLVSRESVELGKIVGLDKSDPLAWVFTLYYRNTGGKDPQLQFFVTDNFGQRQELDVDFRLGG